MSDVHVRALEGFHDNGTRMHKHEQGVMPQARANDLARAGLVSIGPAAAPKQAPVPHSNKMLPEPAPAAPKEAPAAPAAPAVPSPAPSPSPSPRPAPRFTKAAGRPPADR